MIGKLKLLCSSCCYFGLLGQAVAEKPTSGMREGVQLSEQLEQLVIQAIDEGLITATETEGSSSDSDLEVVDHDRNVLVDPQHFSCDQPYYLDFQKMSYLNEYEEVYVYRESVEGTSDAELELEDWTLAQAYIALGLNSEALAILEGETAPQAVAYKKLATLLDNRRNPDLTYFQQLAACHKPANIWYALALLDDRQASGARLLESQLSGLRHLPMQLRVGVASLSVPILEMLDEKFLAEKLLADFTVEEIQNSSHLQFAKTFLDNDTATQSAEAVVRFSQISPRFQEASLSRMLSDQQAVDIAHQDILLDELLNKIKASEDEREVRASLSYALTTLSAESHYQVILQLADLPILQTHSAQDQVRQALMAGLRRDLASDNPLQNLMAIDALVFEVGIFDEDPQRGDLYASAHELAINFGFVSLAEQLALKIQTTETAFLQRAKSAFNLEQYQDVYRFAEKHPGNQQVNLLAALAAIRQENRPLYGTFEKRLLLQPETILSLIEQDAMSDQWMVSEAVYVAAETLNDNDRQQSRVKTVMTLKQLGFATQRPAQDMTIARLQTTLKRTKNSLDSRLREVR